MDNAARLLFRELADLAPAERERLLADRQIAPELRAEVESLLSLDSESSSSLTGCVSATAEEMLRSGDAEKLSHCGPYRLVRLLGSGGMGEVYLAERSDGEIQQKVAVKVLRAGANRHAWCDRFLKERQLLASLNHPSIARVIDAGHSAGGQPYLVMEYVDGLPIDVYADGRDLRDQLMLLLRVCDRVSHAHRQLIIHRDLKPSNILKSSWVQKRTTLSARLPTTRRAMATSLAPSRSIGNYSNKSRLRSPTRNSGSRTHWVCRTSTGPRLRSSGRPGNPILPLRWTRVVRNYGGSGTSSFPTRPSSAANSKRRVPDKPFGNCQAVGK
jgi:hypothetical protein